MYIGGAREVQKNDTNPPIHGKVKYILKILNIFAPTQDWLGAHSRCPETILGWYTRGAMYIGGARGKRKNDTNPPLTWKS